jgi:8-oxo-dGTP pyrophosphatase MutT (NUDIX family)
MPLETPEERESIEVPAEIRESYVRAVSAISPYDEGEEKDIETTLEWLKTAENLNKPHNMEQHLGVFAIVLSRDRGHTFLLNHRKAKMWLPPGGHVDLGQKLHECTLMEVEEELGMKKPKLITEAPIFLTRTLTQGMNAGHIDVTSWFLIEGDHPESTYQVQAKEASQSGWVEIEELLQTAELSNLHRGFRKMLDRGLLRG